MSAIAAFRTAVLKLLDDASSTRFTADQVDQALVAVLNEYSRTNPLMQTYNVDGTGEKIIELPADFQPLHITRVELHDEDADPQIELNFHAYTMDSQWNIALQDEAVETTDTIDIQYSTSHTIDGLSGGAGTTVPAEDEPPLQAGAAGYACLFRAVSRSESVNLQPEVTAALLKLSDGFLRTFRSGVRKSSGPAFVSMPARSSDIF
jgi:hypothetical protein